MANRYITRLVNLEQSDYWIVKRIALERGLGGKGFSAAIRMIIREWSAAEYASMPADQAAPEDGAHTPIARRKPALDCGAGLPHQRSFDSFVLRRALAQDPLHEA